MASTIRILQLSDLHLFGNKRKKLLKINTRTTFNRVLKQVKKDILQKKTELIIISGDLSQDFSKESYGFVKQTFNSISVPTALMLGNHDDEEMFNNVFGKKIQKYFVFHDWQIILLNSHWPLHIAGFLTKKELDFLDAKLSEQSNKPTIIFVHHHTFPVNCPWLDHIAIVNHEQFVEILDKHPNAKAVFCGHIHQESHIKHKNIDFYSTPSTCFQFAPNTPSFKIDAAMPGYRWIELDKDGKFRTGCIRVNHDQNLLPPLDSVGY